MAIIEKKYLYIGTSGTVSAIDREDGSIKWATKLDTGGLLSATTSQDVNILFHEGLIYAGCNGHLFCLNAFTGEVLWNNGLKGYGYNEISLAMEGIAVQTVTRVVEKKS